jgi:hypothetical protein
VDVTAADIAKVPAENLHVSRADFGALWIAAERHMDEQSARKVTDWYGGGVVVTCRWIATATVRPRAGDGPWRPARSPVTGRTRRATPELIEAEALAAALLDMRRPVPDWLRDQPGWARAIDATFAWAWRGTAGPPIQAEHSAAG